MIYASILIFYAKQLFNITLNAICSQSFNNTMELMFCSLMPQINTDGQFKIRLPKKCQFLDNGALNFSTFPKIPQSATLNIHDEVREN